MTEHMHRHRHMHKLSHHSTKIVLLRSSDQRQVSNMDADMFTFVARLVASWFALFLCALYGTVASGLLRIVGYGGLGQWTTARAFKWTMWLFTGVTFDVRDPDRALETRPAVFIGNHQTELDVLMLGCLFPPYTSVTAKSSLKYYPFLGWFMALSKTVFINRSSSTAARAVFASAAETMHQEQQSVFIFPEGTRSYYKTPSMLKFKKGAFHLAVQAQVPIVPCVVANYSNVLDVSRRKFTSGSIPVSVLKAVPTKGLTKEDVDGLTELVRDLMEKELVRITQVAQKEGIAHPAKSRITVEAVGKTTGAQIANSH